MDNKLFTFENILILLLVGVVLMLTLKVNACGTEAFSLDDDMNYDESDYVMSCKQFSMDCCDSPFTNAKGCACFDTNVDELVKSRGNNHLLAATKCAH